MNIEDRQKTLKYDVLKQKKSKLTHYFLDMVTKKQ